MNATHQGDILRRDVALLYDVHNNLKTQVMIEDQGYGSFQESADYERFETRNEERRKIARQIDGQLKTDEMQLNSYHLTREEL